VPGKIGLVTESVRLGGSPNQLVTGAQEQTGIVRSVQFRKSGNAKKMEET